MAEPYGAFENATEQERPSFPQPDAPDVVRQLAHDLRQPLGVIESIAHYLGMILRQDDTRAREQLGKVRGQVRQIDWAIGDALHVLNAAPSALELADLNHLVSRSLSEWAESEDLSIHMRLAPGLPRVRMARAQIRHLLHGMLVLFQQTGGTLGQSSVITEGRPDGVCLAVHGTAPLVAAEEWRRLFDQSGADSSHRAGLTVACLRRIVEAHQARLETLVTPVSEFTLAVVFPLPPASS